ncbi:UNKNOWN [Stylonychia lemnae]|uniref:Uncharacterized protein n=1 Tax=Stylonychia lemnae TaxID=5949 RepID=A0A077ZN19_STYLE|nr:UNKNOWN [Stylonychia lemnae]|eukprot:CDW71367.1 UNKNOWN [Stylonychia lemnae]
MQEEEQTKPQLERLLEPEQYSPLQELKQSKSIVQVNQNKTLYQDYVNLTDISIIEEGELSSRYSKYLQAGDLQLVKNQTQIFINGRSNDDNVGFAMLRDAKTYEEIKLKILDRENNDLTTQNQTRIISIQKIDDYFDDKEPAVYDLYEWYQNIPKREIGKTEPLIYISPDGVLKSITGYPDFEISNYFTSKCLFATYQKGSRTLIFDQETLKVKQDLDHQIFFSYDMQYLGYDSQFNLYQIINSYSMLTIKIGQLFPSEGFSFENKKPLVLPNSIVMHGKQKPGTSGAILIYDKLRFNLINQFTLSQVHEEFSCFIFYDDGLLKYLNNNKKKFYHYKLYNSRFYQEDDLVVQYTNKFKSDRNFITYLQNNQMNVFDLSKKRDIGVISNLIHPDYTTFLQLGSQYFMVGVKRSELYLVKQNDFSVFHKLTMEGSFHHEQHQVVSITNSEIQLAALSYDNFFTNLIINLKDYTAKIQKLNPFEGKLGKLTRDNFYKFFKNEETGQILIIIVANKTLFKYDVIQNSIEEFQGDYEFKYLTICWNNNVIFGFKDCQTIQGYDLDTLEVLPLISYKCAEIMWYPTVKDGYLFTYLSSTNKYLIYEIKNRSLTQKRITSPIIPEETIKYH